jgi:hypothetical protein
LASAWRQASCIVAEDPADHFGFRRNDLAIAGCRYAIGPCARHLVAIAETASGLSDFDATAQSPACLVCKVLEEERVHRALQADVQVRDVALSECHDVHAGEGKAFEKSGGVFLVAAESVERFGENNIEASVQRVAHQRLETGAQQRGARDRVISELLNDVPALASRELPADTQLVCNRRVALVVR